MSTVTSPQEHLRAAAIARLLPERWELSERWVQRREQLGLEDPRLTATGTWRCRRASPAEGSRLSTTSTAAGPSLSPDLPKENR